MEMSIKITRKKGDVDIKDVKAFAKTLAKRNVTSGVHKQEGQQVNYYSGTKVIDYACYNEFGGNKGNNPPARPFVRVKESRELRNNIKRETRDIMNVIIHEKYKGNKVTKVNYLLGSIGTLYVNEMIDRINNSPTYFAKVGLGQNAPRTIEQKGFDHPLIDTMLLAKSLRYKVNVINGK